MTDTLMTTEQEINTETVSEENQSVETSEQTQQQETDQQTDQANVEEGEQNSEQETPQIPESYEFTVPEGVEVDKNFADAVQPVFKDLGLTQEQANKLVSVYAERVSGAIAEQQQTAIQQAEDYVKELKADAEFGGAKFESNVTTALQAVNKFAGDDVKQILDETGLGNHPAIVKMFHQIGTAISEDSFSGNSEKPNEAFSYQTLFKNSNMNP